MSSLLNNQSYKKKVTYYKQADDTQKVSISISLTCNHDLNKDMVNSIERHINSLFFSDYVDEEKRKSLQEAKKEMSEAERVSEKLMRKETKELMAFKKRMGITTH